MSNLDIIKSDYFLQSLTGLLRDKKVIKLFKYNAGLIRRIGASVTLINHIIIRIGNNVRGIIIVNKI